MRTAVLLGCNLVAAAALACGRGDPEGDLRKALAQANMHKVAVDVDPNAHIVHLQGTVDSAADRSRAEEVANAVVGTTGRVLNELTIAGIDDDPVSEMDSELIDRLDAAIDRDPVLKQRDINITVMSGAVTVKGEVRSADEKSRVNELVRALPGVRELANVLAIQPVP